MVKRLKMRPVLDGDFWMIGDNPDLGELNGNRDPQAGKVQECVGDHHIFKASDGSGTYGVVFVGLQWDVYYIIGAQTI